MNKHRLHDEFFKYVFSNKEEVEEFISRSFPKEIVENLNLSTLEKHDTAYVSKYLRKYFSDMVYTCVYKKNIKIKIALLFEHKSTPIPFPHFQLLDYIIEIWRENRRNKKRRSLVLPIVFYHGKKEWVVKDITKYFGKIDDNLKRFIPKFDYILVDTSKLNLEEIESYKSVFLQISIFLLKYVFDTEALTKQVKHFFEKVNDRNFNLDEISTFIEYLQNNIKPAEMEIIEQQIQSILPTNQYFLDLYYARQKRNAKKFLKKGREEGIAKERTLQEDLKYLEKIESTKKMILRGFSDKDISEILDFDIKEIERVRMELNK